MTSERDRVIAFPDRGQYHGMKRNLSSSKCGHVSRDDGEVMRLGEANRDGLDPCGNCWRSDSFRDRVATLGVDDG